MTKKLAFIWKHFKNDVDMINLIAKEVERTTIKILHPSFKLKGQKPQPTLALNLQNEMERCRSV
jgi:hypothetical protein